MNLEVGRHIPLVRHFFLEPKVELDYYRVNSVSYSLNNGLNIDSDAVDYLNGKIGLRAGQNWDIGENRSFEYFLKGGVSHEFMSDQRIVSNNTYEFDDNMKGNRLFYGVEISGNVSRFVQLYGQIEREKGHDYDTDWTFTAGLRLTLN